MKMLRINHVTVTMPSQDLARDFYGRVMGLLEIPRVEEATRPDTTWFQIGDQQLHVTIEPRMPRSRRHVAFEVDNLPALRQQLEAEGIEINEGTQLPGYVRCFAFDPAGNRLELMQRQPARRARRASQR